MNRLWPNTEHPRERGEAGEDAPAHRHALYHAHAHRHAHARLAWVWQHYCMRSQPASDHAD